MIAQPGKMSRRPVKACLIPFPVMHWTAPFEQLPGSRERGPGQRDRRGSQRAPRAIQRRPRVVGEGSYLGMLDQLSISHIPFNPNPPLVTTLVRARPTAWA